MASKRGLIMGVANDRSIAWGIAKTAAANGAELAFTYQGEALEKRVRPLAESVGGTMVLPCDVTDEASMDAVFAEIQQTWGKLDFVVHAIAYSDKDELKGRYVETSRANFQRSLDISCFSFTEVCRRASAIMPDGGSLLTLTYYGAERVMPHYNVMGVAKAALEASVRYLAVDLGSAGIRVNAIGVGDVVTNILNDVVEDGPGFLAQHGEAAPIGRAAQPEEIAEVVAFLASERASFMVGSVVMADGGMTVTAG